MSNIMYKLAGSLLVVSLAVAGCGKRTSLEAEITQTNLFSERPFENECKEIWNKYNNLVQNSEDIKSGLKPNEYIETFLKGIYTDKTARRSIGQDHFTYVELKKNGRRKFLLAMHGVSINGDLLMSVQYSNNSIDNYTITQNYEVKKGIAGLKDIGPLEITQFLKYLNVVFDFAKNTNLYNAKEVKPKKVRPRKFNYYTDTLANINASKIPLFT